MKIGEKYEVVNNNSDHLFTIGDTVEIIGYHENRDLWECKGIDGIKQYLDESDLCGQNNKSDKRE